MNTDSYFAMGKTHTVCQDYARHGIVTDQSWHRNHPFAIVSDGCSSCPDTDIGARLLAVALANTFNMLDCFDYNLALQRAEASAKALSLSPYSLSATLVTAYMDDTGFLRCAFVGDGCIAVKLKDGTGFMAESDHNGAPKYLAYRAVEGGEANYDAVFSKPRMVRFLEIPGLPLSTLMTEHKLMPSSDEYVTWFDLDPDTVEYVLLLSDGASSFVDAGFAHVPVQDVVAKLMDIKSTAGDFIRRRVKFFLAKECPKLGWQHSDDLGVAGIVL